MSSTLTTSNSVATLEINPGETWGKMERVDPGRLFNVNLDDYPILRLNVVQATGPWSFWLYNVTSGWISQAIQSSTYLTGEKDYDIRAMTGWSSEDVQLQMIIYLAGGPGNRLQLDKIQFRRTGHPGLIAQNARPERLQSGVTSSGPDCEKHPASPAWRLSAGIDLGYNPKPN